MAVVGAPPQGGRKPAPLRGSSERPPPWGRADALSSRDNDAAPQRMNGGPKPTIAPPMAVVGAPPRGAETGSPPWVERAFS